MIFLQNHGVLNLMISSLKGVGRHACQLQFLLLVPITFYNGMAMSFVFSEVTRSFTSCVLGVQWVSQKYFIICLATNAQSLLAQSRLVSSVLVVYRGD